MDYSKFTDTIIKDVRAAVALINNPEVAPTVRQLNQEILFREVGNIVYAKIYDMNAFDMEISQTRGTGADPARYYGLAKVASDSISTGKLGLDEYLTNYIDSTIGKAQNDAFKNAKESGKFPTVDRQTVGSKNCPWCIEKAGEYVNPSQSVFLRHGGCDCRIITAGYKTRNGLLDNYVKPKDR